jgi:hypothetical protein
MRKPEAKYYFPFTGEQLDLIEFCLELQMEELDELMEEPAVDSSAVMIRKMRVKELLDFLSPTDDDYYSNICNECGKRLRGSQEDYCSQHCHEASMR